MPFCHSVRAVTVVAALVASATSAAAQAKQTDLTPESYVARAGWGARVVPATGLELGGQRATCGRWPTVLDPHLDDYAAGYSGFIVLNPRVIGTVPGPVQLWIYSHECGHLNGIRDESKADCFGVQRGRREGWLTPRGLDQVCAFISAGRPDAMHLGGPNRCALMRQCYKQTDTAVNGLKAGR